jgi:hypothetical protein
LYKAFPIAGEAFSFLNLKVMKKKTLHIKGYLASQYYLTIQNIAVVFKHIYHVHTWQVAGRYYADIEVGI